MTRSKIGYFVLDPQPGMVQALVRSKPRVVKAYANHGFLRQLIDAGIGPSTFLINRAWWSTDDLGQLRSYTSNDPKEAARQYIFGNQNHQGVISQYRQVPEAYWESVNEFATWDQMFWYGDFEAERQRLMHEEGLHAAIGNFATGTPPLDTDAESWCWPDFMPALEACHKYRNLLGLHEYASLWLALWGWQNQHEDVINGRVTVFPESYGPAPWYLFCRHRLVWDRFIEPAGLTDIRIVLTEWGLDRAGVYTTDFITSGGNSGPWRQVAKKRYWEKAPFFADVSAEAYYTRMLEWGDRQMQMTPYVVGATIFVRGSNDAVWGEWDVQGEVADRLDDYAVANSYPLNYRVVTAHPGLYLRIRVFGLVLWAKGVLSHGEIVEVLEENGDWLHVKRADGLEGWSHRNWLAQA